MKNQKNPKFRIYPSIGVARLGNGKAEKDEVVFSPEVPWANLFETDKNYLTKDGALKKQAQRFYIYHCDEHGNPTHKVDPDKYDIEWAVEVANKKPFWYDFNNSMDLSVEMENHQNLSKAFHDDKIAPGITASSRNPNIPSEGLKGRGVQNYREELVNGPNFASVSEAKTRMAIQGMFPFPKPDEGISKIALKMNTDAKPVKLGTIEYDNDASNPKTNGSLIFYGADGISASLNPSDLNTDFADNSNWYDDSCDGKVTATITTKGGEKIELNTPDSAAWIATAPPDYAPQINPISSLYDLVCGAANHDYRSKDSCLSMILPLFFKFYQMQWVNLGDFLAPSFKETIDKLIHHKQFHLIYQKGPGGDEVRERIFKLFRNPRYDYQNEPIIPSKDVTDLSALGLGTDELKLPYYVGDGINYPGSPAQWFAIPPMLYDQLQQWSEGKFITPQELENTCPANMIALGKYYQQDFLDAAKDDAKAPLLMTRAVLETLYGGGFHPGVELTWPMRHKQMYKENNLTYPSVNGHEKYDLYGLREVRINAASKEEQDSIFYNDFGFLMNPNDVAASLDPRNPRHDETKWLWKTTPGDLTKWMGIPWQSDAGSCQAVWTNAQYPVPAWWAANLPIDVLTAESFAKIQDPQVLDNTKRDIFASRQPWLQTTDTGYVGYHAEGGYLNGLINMVYQWDKIGVVTGRKLGVDMPGNPGMTKGEVVYVAYESETPTPVLIGKSYPTEDVPDPEYGAIYYTKKTPNIWIPYGRNIILSSHPDGTGDLYIDDKAIIKVNGVEIVTVPGLSSKPMDITNNFKDHNLLGTYATIEIVYQDVKGVKRGASDFYLVSK